MLLAVYGTLRKGERAHYLLEDCEFMGTGGVPCESRRDINGYPEIKWGNGNYLEVEIYEVDPDSFEIIEEYEGEGYDIKDIMLNGHNTKIFISNAKFNGYDGTGFSNVEGQSRLFVRKGS